MCASPPSRAAWIRRLPMASKGSLSGAAAVREGSFISERRKMPLCAKSTFSSFRQRLCWPVMAAHALTTPSAVCGGAYRRTRRPFGEADHSRTDGKGSCPNQPMTWARRSPSGKGAKSSSQPCQCPLQSGHFSRSGLNSYPHLGQMNVDCGWIIGIPPDWYTGPQQ